MTRKPTVTIVEWGADEAATAERAIREQRARRPMYIEHLARAMVRGEWRLSNDAIAFVGHPGDLDFRQCNGQHRTIALLRANDLSPGVRIPLLVVEGLTDSDAEMFDQGRVRTLADTLDFLFGPSEDPGHRNTAALVTLAWHVTAGTWANRTPSPTRAQQVGFLKEHPEIADIVHTAFALNRELRGGIAGYGVGAWLASRGRHADRLSTFVEQCATGELLRSTDPAYVFRRAITRAREADSRPGGETGLRGWWVAGQFVFAWNAYVAGDKMNRLPPLRRVDRFPEAS